MASYLLAPAAEADLEEIWLYTASTWGSEQAETYIRELDHAFMRLAENPLICIERTEFSPAVRILPHAHHLVVYTASGGGIVILRVLHERMDVGGQL